MTNINSDWTNGSTRIQFQRCTRCGASFGLPVVACAECGSTKLVTEPADREATLRAITIIYRAPTPELRVLVPYAVAIAQTSNGLRFLGHTSTDNSVGDRVSVALKMFGSRLMPHFERVAATVEALLRIKTESEKQGGGIT